MISVKPREGLLPQFHQQSRDLSKRHIADRILASKAYQRFQSKDAGFGEKTTALAVTGVMKGKTMLGMFGGDARDVREGPSVSNESYPEHEVASEVPRTL